jgi:cytochrome d ubiquinol oxidase subunit I
MDDLIAARSQMAMSLAFHIVFAAIGIAMPLLMVVAEWKWQRTKDEVYLTLARRWAKGTAILFAVGAVSGTVLSFELGLLWPGFMRYAGSIIGMPFSLEGFAFFTEAIFLGIYLYGWNRVPPRAHLFAGVMVAVSGALSGIFVVIANAWMNTPTGFRNLNGNPVAIDPVAAMLNPAAFTQTLHMTLAAYAATGFAVAGVHAFMLRRNPNNRFHRSALAIALTVGGAAAILQPISGDLLAKMVAQNLPVKLAALEGQFVTEQGAPLRIGGIPDETAGVTRFAIEIPYGLSIMAYSDPNAVVKGLNDFPAADRPPVAIVHLSFQLMVACGFAMMGTTAWAVWRYWRGRRKGPSRWLDSKWFLRTLVIVAPLGFVAIETGWVVTEVGRQPWVIYGVMRTADAVTPVSGLVVPFTTFTLLYIFLAAITVWLLLRQVAASPQAFPADAAEVKVAA